ncbi:MAG: alpha/beta hydrolase [Bacteroides sp.]|nr:alpha/beta hydrolase [Bacteroides sp.]MBD5375925.1 alpha/beta hydrolase [Bacteroides sp.]
MRNLLKIVIAATFFLLPSLSFGASPWLPDSLGARFEKRYVDQGRDYHGVVRSTIIRSLASPGQRSSRAVLYIHGFNDYFFQKEMADSFTAHGYDFYAVDLRRYGRSILPGQKPFEARSLKEYFPDIDSALVEITRGNKPEITLMGHSTGGLISAYYMQQHPDAPVCNMVLNSPFLDWNLGRIEWLVPVVSAIGAVLPDLKIPQGASTVYSESLDSRFRGEWTFNRAWKMHHSPDVTAGWVRAIEKAQESLRDHKMSIKIPVLLMYSAQSFMGKEWSADASREDAVLDVADIHRIGITLGPKVTPVTVKGGLHDLFLSSPGVRKAIFQYVFRWLDRHE